MVKIDECCSEPVCPSTMTIVHTGDVAETVKTEPRSVVLSGQSAADGSQQVSRSGALVSKEISSTSIKTTDQLTKSGSANTGAGASNLKTSSNNVVTETVEATRVKTGISRKLNNLYLQLL